MKRSRGFAESSPQQVHFTDIPLDIVQAVQVAQAQSRALAGDTPSGPVHFTETPPDIVQDVRVVAALSAFATATTPPPAELAGTIDQLRKQGVSDDEIRQFLQQLGTSYTFALGEPQGVSFTLPGGHVLSPVQSRLLLAAISTQLAMVNPVLAPVLLPLFQLLPEVANRFNVTIGIGPSLTGAGVAGASLSAGILLAPGSRVGVYGSISAVLGAIVSISATMQVTIVKGGPEVFGGTALAVSIGGGEGVVGSASALMSGDKFIGVSFAMGVGAGITPIEAYAQYQYTPTSLGLGWATA